MGSLERQLITLAMEAYGRDEISRRKVLELASEAGIDVARTESLLNSEFPPDPVPPLGSW